MSWQGWKLAIPMSVLAAVFVLVELRRIARSCDQPNRDLAGQLDDKSFLKVIRERDRFVKVTELRYEMELDSSLDCNFNLDSGSDDSSKIHLTSFCDVYVTKAEIESLKKRSTVFPEGTILIKQKFPAIDALKPELATVMRKRQAGYWPEHGDWEYSVISGDYRTVLARGKIDSCAECHARYEASGFVTGTYLNSPFSRDDWKLGTQPD